MLSRRSILAVLLLGAAVLRAWPLEMSEGRLKLVLHQDLGRFSLYLDELALFVDQDPRTSWLAVLLDNRVYRLGDSGEFKEKAEIVPGGGRFTWTSKRVTVTENLSFQGADSLSLSVTVNNNSDREISAGLRFLLDTHLGETAFPHFRTDRDKDINHELSFGASEMPAYLSSRSSRSPDAPGLLVPLRGAGVTIPDRLVLANWKRLSDAAWLYETAPARNFSDLPYSINDSAASFYFGPAPLSPGGSRTYLILLSSSTEPSPAIGGEASPVPGLTPPPEPPSSPAAATEEPPVQPAKASEAPAVEAAGPGAAPGPAISAAVEPSRRELSIQGDLRVINDLLQQLAVKQESKTALSEEELRLMEQMIAELKKRLESYSD